MKLAAKDKSKKFIPCYKDMDPYYLPDEFKALQAQDLGKMGAEQDILRGVEKILGKNDSGNAVEAILKNPTGISTAAILERAKMALDEGDFKSAESFCEHILNISPRDSEAYLYKLTAIHKKKKPDELATLSIDFTKDINYQRAYKFGSDELKAKLDYFRLCIQYNVAKKAYSEVASLPVEKREARYKEVAVMFDKLEKFKDSPEQN